VRRWSLLDPRQAGGLWDRGGLSNQGRVARLVPEAPGSFQRSGVVFHDPARVVAAAIA
jgi:hypothetical protein